MLRRLRRRLFLSFLILLAAVSGTEGYRVGRTGRWDILRTDAETVWTQSKTLYGQREAAWASLRQLTEAPSPTPAAPPELLPLDPAPETTPPTPVAVAPAAEPQPAAAATETIALTAPIAEPPAPEAAPAEEPISVYFSPPHPDQARADEALFALLRSAKQRIDCAFYELQLMPAAQILIQKKRDGLTVRIVSDSDYRDREAVRACIAAGIPVTFDRRKAFMHDKFLVIDGAVVWTGSTNITENCFFRNNNSAMCFRSAELAENYRAEFEEMFSAEAFGPRSPVNTPHHSVTVGGVPIECYFAPEDNVARAIVAQLRQAQKSIDFMAFSFTSVPIAEAMAERGAAGVRVRGLFEKNNAGSPASRDEFLREHGAEVYLDSNPNNMHNKVIVIDETTTVTGSYNFSKNAEEENDENTLVVHSPAIAQRYRQELETLLAAH